MDQGAVTVVLHEVLGGVFDVVGAIAEAPFVFVPGDIEDADTDSLEAVVEILPVNIRAKISGGGELALLFSSVDIARILAITENEEPKESLDTHELTGFEETANSMISGGVTNLVRALGEEMSVESIDVLLAGPEQANELAEFMGACTAVNFKFQSAPLFDSMATLLVSHALEGRVPDEVVDAYADVDEESQSKLVSDEEMKDILSGFSGGEPEPPQSTSDLQGNLDVIMDIELLATVRLGSVEMPLSEVLRLGPGSIIEVGQLVDDPVELLVNGKLVARGDVVVVDEKFGLRITEIVSRKERIESLR